MSDFHTFFVHFPILLFSAALICDLLHAMGKPKALYLGHWLIILGVLMCIPTILTGLEIPDAAESTDPFVQRHRILGIATGIAGSLYSGLRIAAMWWHLRIRPTFYIGLSVLMVALVSWTSDYGALIKHGDIPSNLVP